MWLGSWTPDSIGSTGGNIIIFEKGKFYNINTYIAGENDEGFSPDSCYFRLQGCRLETECTIISARQYVVSLPNLFN